MIITTTMIMTMHHLFHLLDFCLLLFLHWLINCQLTVMKAILKVKILFKIFFLEDLEEIDRNVKELQLQLEKKLRLQLQIKLSFQETSAKYFQKLTTFLKKKLKNDDINYDELSEIMIPNTQSLFKELNDGKIPDE